MVELNSARVLRDARQTKIYLAITSAELAYVSQSTVLSSTDKLIWINIANNSKFDLKLSCFLTQKQIGDMVGKQPNTIARSIKTLRENGFLDSSYDQNKQATLFFLTLPEAGLETVARAPNKGAGKGNTVESYPQRSILTEKNSTLPGEFDTPLPDFSAYPPIKFAGTPPAKNTTLLIYNNINNKKHNNNDIPKPSVKDDADALMCDFKNAQEKYKDLPVAKRAAMMASEFTPAQRALIYTHQRALDAIADSQQIQAQQEAQAQRLSEKATQVTLVPESRATRSYSDLLEFTFEGEIYFVEEQVKNKIVTQIPELYRQQKIVGEAGKKSVSTLIKEILYYITKTASQSNDDSQLKRFFIAKKLCVNGRWERPNGLSREASIHREQQWQQAKIQENRAAKVFAGGLMRNVA